MKEIKDTISEESCNDLEKLLLEGLNSGYTEIDEDFWENKKLLLSKRYKNAK